MVIEMMWHWELRWWDNKNDRWRVVTEDAEDIEKKMPGIRQAIETAIEEAEETRTED